MSSDDDLNVVLAQREEELRPTSAQRATYFAAALLTVLVPLFMFQTLFGFDVEGNIGVVVTVCVFAAAIITFAYHNVAFSVKTSLLSRREVPTSVKAPQGTDRRAYIQELRDILVQNTQNEATAFAVLYNNVLFLLAVSLGAFFVFSSASTTVNYILSVSVGAACTSLGTATVLAPSK